MTVTNDKGREMPTMHRVPSAYRGAPRLGWLVPAALLVSTLVAPRQSPAQTIPGNVVQTQAFQAQAQRIQAQRPADDDWLPDFAAYVTDADEKQDETKKEESSGPKAWWHGIPIYKYKDNFTPGRIFFRHGFRSWDGAMADENPLWGTPNLSVSKPKDYPHITSLDNDDPSSFWYTLRPNLFNVPVSDEWDWLSMINTERSDFTDLTYTVGKGVTYLETGYTYTHIANARTRFSQRDLPNMLLRYGVTNEFEVRLGWTGYTMIDQRAPASGARFNDFGGDDISVGFKYELWQQKNWLPMNVLLAGTLLPTGTRGFSGNSVQPFFAVIQGWGIKRWLYFKHESGLNYLTQPFATPQMAGGMTTAGNPASFLITRPHVNQWHESVSLIGHLSKHFGGFVEWFTLFGANQVNKHFLDIGLFIYPTPNVQFDVALYRRVDGTTDEFVLKSGFATRW